MEKTKNVEQTKQTRATKSSLSKNAKRKESITAWSRRALICGTIIGVCALVVLGVFVLNVLATPVAIILWTSIFVLLLRGIVNKLDEKGVNRVLGTAIAYVIMALVIAIICLFMFSPVFGLNEQIKNFVSDIPQYVDMVRDWAYDVYGKYGHFLQNESVQKWMNDAAAQLGSMGGAIASASASGIIAAGTVIGNSFMAFGFALVIAFWVLIELPALGKEVQRFIKPKHAEEAEMWKISFSYVMTGYIKGTFIQCVIIGVLAGLLFWALGIPNPGALGCITGVLNIIPIFGPWIGGAVAAIAGIFISPWIALFAVVGTICIQQFVYTFISPKIMSSACNIHPALTLLAMLAGGAIGGAMSGVIGSLVGMLLAIPFVAVFKSLFIYYYERRTGVRIVDEKGVFFKGYPKSHEKANPMDDALCLNNKDEEKLKKQIEKNKKKAEKRAKKLSEQKAKDSSKSSELPAENTGDEKNRDK